jgi:hypothetical protein
MLRCYDARNNWLVFTTASDWFITTVVFRPNNFSGEENLCSSGIIGGEGL